MNKPTDNIVRKRGRPQDPERQVRMVASALELFLQNGVTATSMEAVATHAGVSKMTLYKYFENKDVLFARVIDDYVDKYFSNKPILNPQISSVNELKQWLTAIATHTLSVIRDPIVLGMHRVMFASTQHQEICQKFYQVGSVQIMHILESAVDKFAIQTGYIKNVTAQLFCHQMISLLEGPLHSKALLGLGVPSAQEDAQIVKNSIQILMTAYANS